MLFINNVKKLKELKLLNDDKVWRLSKTMGNLEYNVLKLDINSNKFNKYNIFNHYRFLQKVSRILGSYHRRVQEEINDLKLFEDDDLVTKREIKATKQKWEVATENWLSKEISQAAKYYFSSKCEYEILLCEWPNAITIDELKRLNDELSHHMEKWTIEPYRLSVNCDGAEKIDIYDQLQLNWDIFIKYLKDNRKQIKELAKQEKEKYKELKKQKIESDSSSTKDTVSNQ